MAGKKIGGSIICIEIVNAFLLCAEALAWGFGGNEGTLGFWMVRISNFLVFILSYVSIMLAAEYIKVLLEEKGMVDNESIKKDTLMRMGTDGICALMIVLLVISQFTHWCYDFDARNNYYCKEAYGLPPVIGIAGIALQTAIVVRNRKQFDKAEYFTLLIYMGVLILFIPVQYFFNEVCFINIIAAIFVLLLFASCLMEQFRRMAEEQKRILNEANINVLQSQIRPHFLFNSLSTIRYLCRTDPQTAAEAVDELAGYLRGSADVLTQQGCVSFEREMELVKSYLYLEKKRFGKHLKVVYDIRAGDFLLPPLSVQTMVENAVQHGIRGKLEGGTLLIESWEDETHFKVSVMDNGAGFAADRKPADGKSHVGIENVRSRLQMMCNGTLEIMSLPGKGTKVVLWLPKETGP